MAKILFMGTPAFAVPSLKALMSAHDVVAVVTQPDRPAGRNRRPRLSPVKQLAQSAGIPVFQPKRIRQPDAIAGLRAANADLFVVVAFGQILPQTVLELPRYGTINVHASLLPRWRGAAPIQAAIRAGDGESGVTIMLLDAGLDTGPTLTSRGLQLAEDETGESLHDKLSVLGADLLVDTLPRFLNGDITPIAQDETRATYAPQIKKEDGEIDWTQPAIVIERLVRAFTPWPGTYTQLDGDLLKIIAGYAAIGSAPSGQVCVCDGEIAIGTGDGLYFPLELQLAGKKRLSIGEFTKGQRNLIGSVLGN